MVDEGEAPPAPPPVDDDLGRPRAVAATGARPVTVGGVAALAAPKLRMHRTASAHTSMDGVSRGSVGGGGGAAAAAFRVTLLRRPGLDPVEVARPGAAPVSAAAAGETGPDDGDSGIESIRLLRMPWTMNTYGSHSQGKQTTLQTPPREAKSRLPNSQQRKKVRFEATTTRR